MVTGVVYQNISRYGTLLQTDYAGADTILENLLQKMDESYRTRQLILHTRIYSSKVYTTNNEGPLGYGLLF